ncbi:hypothetical protein D3C80_2234760 [compost metagenome]
MIAIIAELDCPFAIATMNRVTADMAESPPANPSIPSEKLITVVTPNIHRMVRINCRKTGSRTYSPDNGL